MTWINLALGGLVDAALSPVPVAAADCRAGRRVARRRDRRCCSCFARRRISRRLLDVKRQIHAGIFEIRLFNDDLRAMFARAVRHPAPQPHLPAAVAGTDGVDARSARAAHRAVAVLLRLRRLQPRTLCGRQGSAEGGGHSLVRHGARDRARTPPGLRVQTALVWIPSEREAAWRIGIDQPGDYELTVTLDGRSVTKQVRVSNQVGWRTPERLEAGFLNQLLYPAEAPLEADVPIEAILVAYPEREVSLLGYPVHWMIAFFVLSLVFAFALKSRFGVVI